MRIHHGTLRGFFRGGRPGTLTSAVFGAMLLGLLAPALPRAQETPQPQDRGAISLADALMLSARRDPWIDRSSQMQAALDARGIAAGALPDPVLTVGLANLPTDTFRFNQEPMTQAQLGITQRIPRGDSRELQRRKFTDLSAREPLERAKRRAKVQREVTRAWLGAYRAQRSMALIEANRSLFDYLVDLARSRYSSVLARTQQQDLVRAELELTRLEDRLFRLRSSRDESLAVLAGWLLDPRQGAPAMHVTGVTEEMPPLTLQVPSISALDATALDQFLAARLQEHPHIKSLDQRIAASHTERELAEQSYRPGWSLNASYGYREDNPLGESRADFFSLGVALELPLYTSMRQDPQVRAAVADSEALRTERALLLRELRSGVHMRLAKLTRLRQRAALYRGRLLRQMQEQSEAYLSAYRADEADFNEVVGARIGELNAQIEALNVDVDVAETIAELNYLLAVASPREEGAS